MKSVVMKIKLDDGARMPEKAHATDVGYCRGSDIQERSECQARHYLNSLDKTERGDGSFGSTGK